MRQYATLLKERWHNWDADPCLLTGVVSIVSDRRTVEICGAPHLAKNERDTPNFLHVALDKTACAPFFKERRMKSAEPMNLHRKSGIWGTQGLWSGQRAAMASQKLRCNAYERVGGVRRWP
jgi:hypothetical protein